MLKDIDFTKMCRICLKDSDNCLSIFQNNANSMLQFCDFLEVTENDGFPEQLCKDCYNALSQSYELKKLCISSKLYFQSLLVKASNKLVVLYNGAVEHLVEEDDANSNSECNSAIVKSVQNEKDFTNKSKCSKCNLFFSDETEANMHICCSLEEQKRELQKTLQNLIEENEEENSVLKDRVEKLRCSKCPLKFEHENDLSIHQSVHSEDLRCNVCKKCFSALKILKRHTKIHMISKRHVCNKCNQSFAESTALIKHTKTHHLGIPREKKYICKECGKRFTDHYYLSLHTRKHTGEKPLKCNTCNKSFYDPRSLKVHVAAHLHTKPYLCSHCGKLFTQSSNLKTHLVVHTKEKLFKCKNCSKSFTQASSLRRHETLHTKRAFI